MTETVLTLRSTAVHRRPNSSLRRIPVYRARKNTAPYRVEAAVTERDLKLTVAFEVTPEAGASTQKI